MINKENNEKIFIEENNFAEEQEKLRRDKANQLRKKYDTKEVNKDCNDNNEEIESVENVEGEFRDGKRHGPWVLKYPNGDVYDGEFRVGKKHGKGLYR
jgi:hypothetical protein